MGMFDDLRCEIPLPPGGWVSPYDFQTKDLDCEFDKYVITKDRRLTRNGETIDFHGTLNFYKYDGKYRHEYNAKFTDGQLVKICLVNSSDKS